MNLFDSLVKVLLVGYSVVSLFRFCMMEKVMILIMLKLINRVVGLLFVRVWFDLMRRLGLMMLVRVIMERWWVLRLCFMFEFGLMVVKLFDLELDILVLFLIVMLFLDFFFEIDIFLLCFLCKVEKDGKFIFERCLVCCGEGDVGM